MVPPQPMDDIWRRLRFGQLADRIGIEQEAQSSRSREEVRSGSIGNPDKASKLSAKVG
jgi:hypothetical protein